jgi:hypothetical protein
MTARGPRKATSRMSGKVESDGGQSMFSQGNSRVQQFTRGVFLASRSIHAALRPRIGFSTFNLPRRVCPGCPTLLRQLGSYCRSRWGRRDGKRANTAWGVLPVGSLPRAIGSVLQRNERQARSGCGVHSVHKKEILGLKRSSISSRSTAGPASHSRNP